MIDLQIVDEFVYENFELVSVSKSGTHWHTRCLLCGDSKKNTRKKRFHLDYNDGNPIWHCWNCGQSGSFLQLYSTVKAVSIEEAKRDLYKFNPERLKTQLSTTKCKVKKEERNAETFNWIRKQSIGKNDKCSGIVCEKYKEVLLKFINDRKIPSTYDIRICINGDYKGRIIVPVVDRNDDIVYFQARRLPGSGIIPKYKNPSVEKGIILNEHNFEKSKYIIITEGLIDAFMIGNQGTTCLGSSISDDFLYNIFCYTNKGVIIAFDNPFIDEQGIKSLTKFMIGYTGGRKRKKKDPSKYAKRVLYFIPPPEHRRQFKDINNIRVECNIENMYEYVVKNSHDFLYTYTTLKF